MYSLEWTEGPLNHLFCCCSRYCLITVSVCCFLLDSPRPTLHPLAQTQDALLSYVRKRMIFTIPACYVMPLLLFPVFYLSLLILALKMYWRGQHFYRFFFFTSSTHSMLPGDKFVIKTPCMAFFKIGFSCIDPHQQPHPTNAEIWVQRNII